MIRLSLSEKITAFTNRLEESVEAKFQVHARDPKLLRFLASTMNYASQSKIEFEKLKTSWTPAYSTPSEKISKPIRAIGLRERIPESRLTSPWFNPALLEATPSRTVFEEGSLKVKLYASHEYPARGQVLLFPSLINRPYILDLGKGRSLIQAMVKSGLEVIMFDWGSPGERERDLGLHALLHDRIPRALHTAYAYSDLSKDDPRPKTVMGHCLGGNIALLFASLEQTKPNGLHIDRIVTLTTPIDTENESLLNTWFQIPNWKPDLFAQSFQNIPWPILQFSFQMLRPTMTPRRWRQFASRLTEKDYRDSWLQMEIWSNDNISFSSELFKDLLIPLYRDNAMLREGDKTPLWNRVRQLKCRVFAISAEDDHIVPSSSARAIVQALPRAEIELHCLRGGHIGAVLSNKTRQAIWPQMMDFMTKTASSSARTDDRTGSRPHASPSPISPEKADEASVRVKSPNPSTPAENSGARQSSVQAQT